MRKDLIRKYWRGFGIFIPKFNEFTRLYWIKYEINIFMFCCWIAVIEKYYDSHSSNFHKSCNKIEGYDGFELPLPKQESNVVRISDRVKSWHPQRDGESFEECLAREGYEYTPIPTTLDAYNAQNIPEV